MTCSVEVDPDCAWMVCEVTGMDSGGEGRVGLGKCDSDRGTDVFGRMAS
jgi:hypothetical protein